MFNFLEVFIESCYWCDYFALKFFRGVNFVIANQFINSAALINRFV